MNLSEEIPHSDSSEPENPDTNECLERALIKARNEAERDLEHLDLSIFEEIDNEKKRMEDEKRADRINLLLWGFVMLLSLLSASSLNDYINLKRKELPRKEQRKAIPKKAKTIPLPSTGCEDFDYYETVSTMDFRKMLFLISPYEIGETNDESVLTKKSRDFRRGLINAINARDQRDQIDSEETRTATGNDYRLRSRRNIRSDYEETRSVRSAYEHARRSMRSRRPRSNALPPPPID